MSYEPPKPSFDSIWDNGQLVHVYTAADMQAAHEAGRASRDAEVEALRADLKHTEECCVGWATDYGKSLKEVEALKTELRKGDDLRERLSSILTRSVNAIRGEPEPLGLHSWHDLPELVEALRADALRYQWLRDNFPRLIVNTTPVCLGENDDGTLIVRTYVQHFDVNENFRFAVPESVDKAIDAAMSAQGK